MIELRVAGMSCQHCVIAVKKALEAVDGVTGVRVDLDRGQAEVEGEADVADLVAAVEGVGYTATPVP